MGVWFSFIFFQTIILKVVNVATSYLHLNNWVFLRVFKILCSTLGITWALEQKEVRVIKKPTTSLEIGIQQSTIDWVDGGPSQENLRI